MINNKIRVCFLVLFFGLAGFSYKTLEAGNPRELPLIEFSNLEYVGAFRLPQGPNGDLDGFSFGGYPLAYNPIHDSLFVGNKNGKIGEVSIPQPVNDSNVKNLPFALSLQSLKDPTEGKRSVLEGSSVLGLIVEGGKIYGTGNIYYDATNSARVSHFSRSTDLNEVSATPLYSLWQADKSGFVSGWVAKVPAEWQELLGGSLISGNCCIPIISRTSFGPSAFAWNPDDLGQKTPIPATPLLYYPSSHPTLGPWSGSNPIYGGTTTVGGMALIKGTRSLLYFGMNGVGTFCYAIGTADSTLAERKVLDGEEKYCYDPLSSDKGQHAYPYNYQIWAYDLNELAEVKLGKKEPWDVKPYAVWKIDFKGPVYMGGIGGVAYDESRQLLYLAQARADVDGYSSRALIHVYKVNLETSHTALNVSSAPYPTPQTFPAEVVNLPVYVSTLLSYSSAYPAPVEKIQPIINYYLTPYVAPYQTPSIPINSLPKVAKIVNNPPTKTVVTKKDSPPKLAQVSVTPTQTSVSSSSSLKSTTPTPVLPQPLSNKNNFFSKVGRFFSRISSFFKK